MKILLLAPHPFYQERGTPIAVVLLLKALSASGKTVDVLTYAEGEDFNPPANVTIHRARRPPLVSGVRPGFSLKKIVCDLFMLPKALRMARENRYDLVHAVEESVFMAMLIRRKHGIPYVFDMDSSMPEQIADRHRLMRPLLPLMNRLEGMAARNALAVVPMCESLAERARSYGAAKTAVLRDISLLDDSNQLPRQDLRKDLNIRGICFLYLGNLEKYQGIDLLLKSFAILLKSTRDANLVIAGGTPADIKKYSSLSRELETDANVHFIGPKPIRMMAGLFENADVLVSPRTQGQNTPMKIYSYLDSGKAIIATRIPSHTQVLNDDVAILEQPDPEAFARGMKRLAEDQNLRREIGTRARTLAREEHSFPVYERAVRELHNWIEQLPQPEKRK